MSIPTVAEVQTEIQDLLGDPTGKVITTAVAFKGYQRAYRRLRQALLNRQVSVVRKERTYDLSAGTSSLTPSTAGISDFGEIVRMEEREYGTSDDYTQVRETERLPQRDSLEVLLEYEWREDTWYFIPSTLNRTLKITYLDNAQPPTSGSVGIDGSLPFLSLYGAAVAGRTKQYIDEAETLMIQAVGSALDDKPQESGELLRLMRAMVRSLQKTPIQPKPYGVGRTYKRSTAVPYIAAPPAEGSLATVTLIGTQDGSNAIFILNPSTPVVAIFKNGQKLAEGTGYTRSGSQITFLAGYIPEAGDILEALG